MSDNKLLIEFIDESQTFVNGFECGQIWTYLGTDCADFKDYPIHLENSAQIQAICDYFNAKCTITPIDDTWAILNTIGLTKTNT